MINFFFKLLLNPQGNIITTIAAPPQVKLSVNIIFIKINFLTFSFEISVTLFNLSNHIIYE